MTRLFGFCCAWLLLVPVAARAQSFAAYIASETKKYGDVVAAAGLRQQQKGQ